MGKFDKAAREPVAWVDDASGTLYPTQSSVDKYLPEGRTVRPLVYGDAAPVAAQPSVPTYADAIKMAEEIAGSQAVAAFGWDNTVEVVRVALERYGQPDVSTKPGNVDTSAQCVDGVGISSVPDGWKLVPVKPTVDMTEAGMDHVLRGQDYERAQGCWKAMLSAAPTPPSDGQVQQPYKDNAEFHRKATFPELDAWQRGWDECEEMQDAVQQDADKVDYEALYEQMCGRCDYLDKELAEYEHQTEPVAPEVNGDMVERACRVQHVGWSIWHEPQKKTARQVMRHAITSALSMRNPHAITAQQSDQAMAGDDISDDEIHDLWVEHKSKSGAMGFARALLKRVQPASVTISEELLRFLHGSGEIDGVWFGDKHPKHPGRFWWRALIPQPGEVHPASGEDARRVIDCARAALDASTETDEGDIAIPSHLAAPLSLALDEHDKALQQGEQP